MRKLVLTIAIVLGMTLGTSAQTGLFGDNGQPQGGGLFGRGATPEGAMNAQGNSDFPLLPIHNQEGNQDAPIGNGALLLIGMGAAYAMTKKNRK